MNRGGLDIMLTHSLRTDDADAASDGFGHSDALSAKADLRYPDFGRSLRQVIPARPNGQRAASAISVRDEFLESFVDITPADAVRRHVVLWSWGAAEIIQDATRKKFEVRFRAPVHLLVICERGVRQCGDTFVEGLPHSGLRNLTRKLTFVPAGHDYCERQEPRTFTRLIYVYFDPDRLRVPSLPSTPRLHFEDANLLETALKLPPLIENPAPNDQAYLETLGAVLAHEVVRLYHGAPRARCHAQGGLAPWQQRVITSYIEEHLAEQLSLTTLAQLVGLSSFYFCRAFKQSFGLPPHRYHIARRIEHAKALLAQPWMSVTEIGMRLGFSDTSAFTAAFRKVTGVTPTTYHRSLA
jgi:AraC family transcriptional regulator